MFKYIILFAALFILLSCSGNQRGVNLQRTLKNDTSSTASANLVVFDDPDIIDSSGIIAYPLILNTSYYSYGSSGGKDRKESYWNYVFYNARTAEQHLLAHGKIVLYGSYFENQYGSGDESAVSVFNNAILYTGTSKDYNADSMLDSHDPVYLFASDKQGNNFRQLSPNDCNIISWKTIKGTTKIILQGQKDDNGDKVFDGSDKTISLIVDVSQNNMASETFSNNYIDSLKQILIETWRKH